MLMFRSRFFWRNLLSYAIVISLTTFVVSYLLTVRTEEFVKSDSKDMLLEKLTLIAPILKDRNRWHPDQLAELFESAAKNTDTRITVIDSSGHVLFESEVNHINFQNHIDRPEIAQSMNQPWGTAVRSSDTLKLPMLFVAKKITSGDDHVYLRFALPMSKLDKRLEDIRYVLGIGALVGMFVSLLIALFLAKRITRPISAITHVAEAISRGNYNARLRHLPKNELGTLGKAINRLAEAVQANISKREKMEQIRREFSSNVSHELKTPLTSIKGYVETLIEGGALDSKDDAKRFLKIIEANIERITSLVTDLLRLSTIEANQGLISLESVDWKPVISEVLMRQEINLKKKSIRFNLNAPDSISKVMGSRKAMTHILDNLLQNALNYTPEGGSITVGLTQKTSQVVLTVEDTGIGISKRDQSRIFERFYRVDSARSRDDGGTGLGLAIVKHLVIQIQGTINVQSELNKGSIFTVTLPTPQT
ncbi:sensor histidine kinase [Pseudobacteriovorax antillogorgiicola]|uniref:histidine kinase n=1 Tax=Pseudobacteriovorax antillogorgiicola TaxID=1513793 RepID=A0A1Y6CW70_9BACT|nr:ATP-binding protein [Pseudobacteriovorax antillogorgiicola]TCS44411.1 two-component system phosphate regulon sensor histidine kinase PhoR [Pseudobacteriovorax antillogorgiicola]SMF79192.1 two-component system, OmpR family, phosphate regulon sensor histidine kinase PhoR [Pseudobacteriovorax antillogorgiicola]